MRKPLLLVPALFVAFACLPAGAADEPDHDIHEQLRRVLYVVQGAIGSGRYDDMLPVLAENVEATSLTQEVMANRNDVSAYFKEWFGPGGYMKSLDMKLTADSLTELSPDKTWGLVRGKGVEHYVAKDGDEFDFASRWTAVMAKGADDKWRLRAIHFGTNHLDNPVLTKVRRTLTRYAIAGGFACLVVGLAAGWMIGRRRRPAPT